MMLTVYTSHDRDLLFVGDDAERDKMGIQLHPETREVTVGGRRRLVVNNTSSPGHLSLWVV